MKKRDRQNVAQRLCHCDEVFSVMRHYSFHGIYLYNKANNIYEYGIEMPSLSLWKNKRCPLQKFTYHRGMAWNRPTTHIHKQSHIYITHSQYCAVVLHKRTHNQLNFILFDICSDKTSKCASEFSFHEFISILVDRTFIMNIFIFFSPYSYNVNIYICGYTNVTRKCGFSLGHPTTHFNYMSHRYACVLFSSNGKYIYIFTKFVDTFDMKNISTIWCLQFAWIIDISRAKKVIGHISMRVNHKLIFN